MSSSNSHSAVSLKLPTFWATQPHVWFEQAEAQFNIRDITADATRYYYVVSTLDQETAGRIIDFLRQPPTEDRYTKLKALLIRTFGLSRRERAARLLHMDGLGDRTPSELMNDMLALMDGHKPCLLFEQLFLEQMPEDIRLLLASEDFSDPRRVAAKADILWQSKQCGAASIGLATIARPKAQAPQPKPSRPTGEKDESSEQWCFYHQRWGSGARRCRPPCAFPGNAGASHR